MKTVIHLLATVSTLALLHAQGPLSPPGLPAPTMKTLDQIEARTAIPPSLITSPVAGPHFTITQPGSYYLTGNVEVTSGNGIEINASNVTLDLNGFALINTAIPASGYAIELASGTSGIEIKNGRIAGGAVRTYVGPLLWQATFDSAGWISGIQASGPTPSTGLLVSHLTVEKCGFGINSGKGASLDHITATANAYLGINASDCCISNSTATSNGGNGIEAFGGTVTNTTTFANAFSGINASGGTLANCNAYGNGGIGIIASFGSVTNSTATSNGTVGISVENGSVTNATARSNASSGIYADGGSVTNCTAFGNGDDGIHAATGSVTNSRASVNFHNGIEVGAGVAAHCVASNNSTDPGTVDQEIAVTPGVGQRDACVPAAE